MAEHVERARPPQSMHREPPEHTRPPTMGRATRGILGVLSFVPLVLAVAAIVRVAAGPEDPARPGVPAMTDVGGVLIGTILALALLVLYFGAFVMNDRNVEGRAKVLWLIGFIVGGPIVIPLYWYIHVLHAPRRGTER
jgi:hypothetical protein